MLLTMSNHDLAVIVLAAGKGTRLKSSLAKVLHRAGGRTLAEHIVRACAPLKARDTIVVVGHQADQVASVVEPLGAVTVLQQPQNGTGHAAQVAKRALGRAKFALVLPGDAPLVRTETLKALMATHRSGNASATILSAVVADPSGYGRIVRKSETAVSAIVEESQLTDEQREINEINSAIYCFTLEDLWPALAQVKPNNKHHEIYLTDAIAVISGKGQTVLAEVAADPREVLGCNTRADLAEVDRIFREWKRSALMDAGVTIQLPETVLIDPEVTAGEDTVIEAGGHFRVDKHSLRQLNRHARVHERAAFPFAEDAVDFGEVCARIATQNFARVGGHFCQHGLALAAYHCDSIGQIDFVVFVVGFYLREGRPKIFQREAVNRGIDFVDFALLVGQLRFLDNRGNSRLGFADNASITRRIGDHSGKNCGRRVAAAMRGHERL